MIVKCIGDPTFEFEIGQLEPSLLDSDFVTRFSDFGMKLKSDFMKKVIDVIGGTTLDCIIWLLVDTH